MKIDEIISGHLSEHLSAVEKLGAQKSLIADMARRLITCLESGGKALFFGNGGSAADAQHLAAELVVRYRRNRRALPAISLSTDTSILTAGANDFGFESIFSRQIEALAGKGDVAIGISTSGTSANVISGLEAAKKAGCVVMVFTGQDENPCSLLADIAFHAPSSITARIQECHLLVGHILCDLVEEAFVS